MGGRKRSTRGKGRKMVRRSRRMRGGFLHQLTPSPRNGQYNCVTEGGLPACGTFDDNLAENTNMTNAYNNFIDVTNRIRNTGTYTQDDVIEHEKAIRNLGEAFNPILKKNFPGQYFDMYEPDTIKKFAAILPAQYIRDLELGLNLIRFCDKARNVVNNTSPEAKASWNEKYNSLCLINQDGSKYDNDGANDV